MNSKMKSLKEFELSQNEMDTTKGGLYYGHGVYWREEREADYVGSFNIGTYVDGMNMGTDGYKD
ncbi:hypothetical protein [Tenacibaculum sp. 1B UA]|uniref:hypothetical protein n=2 Tax=unclassified Tenacibaculum TaxID=2635139 RepID=UPI002A2470A4|nr:hypothetical protein [Tenacibaculum sp. 1B UA]